MTFQSLLASQKYNCAKHKIICENDLVCGLKNLQKGRTCKPDVVRNLHPRFPEVRQRNKIFCWKPAFEDTNPTKSLASYFQKRQFLKWIALRKKTIKKHAIIQNKDEDLKNTTFSFFC